MFGGSSSSFVGANEAMPKTQATNYEANAQWHEQNKKNVMQTLGFGFDMNIVKTAFKCPTWSYFCTAAEFENVFLKIGSVQSANNRVLPNGDGIASGDNDYDSHYHNSDSKRRRMV